MRLPRHEYYLVIPPAVLLISGSKGNRCSSGGIEYNFFQMCSKGPGVFQAKSSLRSHSLMRWRLGSVEPVSALSHRLLPGSRILFVIPERFSGMQETHAVDVLNVAFLEIQPQGVFLCQKMHRIESLRLCLRDRRYVRTSLLRTEAGEMAARVLDNRMTLLHIQYWSGTEWRVRPESIQMRSAK